MKTTDTQKNVIKSNSALMLLMLHMVIKPAFISSQPSAHCRFPYHFLEQLPSRQELNICQVTQYVPLYPDVVSPRVSKKSNFLNQVQPYLNLPA